MKVEGQIFVLAGQISAHVGGEIGVESLFGRENAKFSISKKNCFRFSGTAKEGGSWRKDVGTMVNAE